MNTTSTIMLNKGRISSRISQVCYSENSKNTKNSISKLFPLLDTEKAKKRNASIKENINKLIAIANNDVKEFNELIKEFDVEHKKALKMKSESGTESGGETSDDENIFIDK